MPVTNSTPQRDVCLSQDKIEVTLNQAELFRAQCEQLIKETGQSCKRLHETDQKEQGSRLRDVQFLRKELELKLDEILGENDNLGALRCRVQKALEACNEPLRISNQCLEERSNCPDDDISRDQVNVELKRERDVIKGVANLLQHVLQQISEQLRLNQSIKYHLEQDLREKVLAEGLDNPCAILAAQPGKNLLGSKNENTSSTIMTPEQWESLTFANIAKAEQQKNNSRSLQALVDSVLEQTAGDMQNQAHATTAAFLLNIQELKNAKKKMEEKLVQVQAEICSQKKIREDLQIAIAENEQCLSVTQANLVMCFDRPTKDHYHDPAFRRVINEVQQLTSNINQLHQGLERSEDEERALFRCHLKLQEEIEVKTKCLYIDEVVCMQHRESIIIPNFSTVCK